MDTLRRLAWSEGISMVTMTSYTIERTQSRILPGVKLKYFLYKYVCVYNNFTKKYTNSYVYIYIMICVVLFNSKKELHTICDCWSHWYPGTTLLAHRSRLRL